MDLIFVLTFVPVGMELNKIFKVKSNFLYNKAKFNSIRIIVFLQMAKFCAKWYLTLASFFERLCCGTKCGGRLG